MNAPTTTPTSTRTPSDRWWSRPRLQRGLAAALAAVAINLVLLVIGNAASADMQVPDMADPETFLDLRAWLVVVATLLPLPIAFLVAAALERFRVSWYRRYPVLVLVALVLSYVPTLTSGMSAGTVVVLMLMHLPVAVAALALGPRPFKG